MTIQRHICPTASKSPNPLSTLYSHSRKANNIQTEKRTNKLFVDASRSSQIARHLLWTKSDQKKHAEIVNRQKSLAIFAHANEPLTEIQLKFEEGN
jgi:hypothetical protein